jgi:cytochrome c oxidase subunit 2
MQTFLAMFPRQASTHAAEVDHMTILVHWLMLVLFIGWGFFFLFVLFRFRKGANPKASYTGAHGKFAKSTEVAVAIIEIALLVFYAIPAWATRVKAFPSESDAGVVVVRVVAHQFAWEMQYPGPDGKFGRTDPKLVTAENNIGIDRTDPNAKDDIVTTNQLMLPVDRPGLYEMRVKQDAIPGMSIPVWFIPNRTGEFEIACSQLCGLGHFRMRGFITIQSAADYQKWYDDQQKELRPAVATPTAP